MTPEERLEKLNFKINEAHQVLQVAQQSGNQPFLEKAKKALEQFEIQRQELLESFPLEQIYNRDVKQAEEFKLNLGISGQSDPGKVIGEVEESLEDLPPHLKR